MTATDLPKGAIYRRFKNKDAIALASFKRGGEIMWQHFYKAMENKEHTIDKIIALFLYTKMQPITHQSWWMPFAQYCR